LLHCIGPFQSVIVELFTNKCGVGAYVEHPFLVQRQVESQICIWLW